MSLRRLAPALIGLLLSGAAPPARACLWDADTLLEERLTNPKMAAAIFNAPPKPDVARLRARIEQLRATPREDDPAWWNDLAGAHLRLGELQTAVELLEPAARRFPNDYGVHANLGTAYHLLKRYPEAEREIARDLELNPDAHFGLERYHLALLQYLVRDPAYQARHVYVDEWTEPFHLRPVPLLLGPGGKLPASAKNTFQPTKNYDGTPPLTLAQEIAKLKKQIAEAQATAPGGGAGEKERLAVLQAQGDRPPPYRYRWDLAKDPKFVEGIIYMASLNRQEPACWVMLGVASLDHADLNLAAAAFQRAVELKSPQAPLLKEHIEAIHDHQRQSRPARVIDRGLLAVLGGLLLLVLFGVARGIRRLVLRRRREMETAA